MNRIGLPPNLSAVDAQSCAPTGTFLCVAAGARDQTRWSEEAAGGAREELVRMVVLPGRGSAESCVNHAVAASNGRWTAAAGTARNRPEWHAAQQCVCAPQCEWTWVLAAGSWTATKAVSTASRNRRKPSWPHHLRVARAGYTTAILVPGYYGCCSPSTRCIDLLGRKPAHPNSRLVTYPGRGARA